MFVFVWASKKWFVWPCWNSLSHTRDNEEGLVHAVEGEREHKVWSLASAVHTHTRTLHSFIPFGRRCLALTVCVGVCQSKGQHHQSSGCTRQPSTLTHTHTCSYKLFFFFNFQPEGQHHNKHGTRHVLHLQGQAVYVLQSPLFGSCKHAIISLFMCINLIFRVFARLLSPEPQHPGGYGLRCGPSPLGCLPGPPAAVWGLETCVEHSGHQHWRVPPPQTCPLP